MPCVGKRYWIRKTIDNRQLDPFIPQDEITPTSTVVKNMLTIY